jgi:hypothetical protein
VKPPKTSAGTATVAAIAVTTSEGGRRCSTD